MKNGKVTVCAACLKVSCLQSLFHCEKYARANVVEVEIERLYALGLEHPSYFDTSRSDYSVDYIKGGDGGL